MLKLLHLHERSLATLLAIMAMLMLAGCSSTDEAAQPEDTGGGGGSCEDCSVYSGTVDQAECETRNSMRDC
jgi:hypothetical protein